MSAESQREGHRRVGCLSTFSEGEGSGDQIARGRTNPVCLKGKKTLWGGQLMLRTHPRSGAWRQRGGKNGLAQEAVLGAGPPRIAAAASSQGQPAGHSRHWVRWVLAARLPLRPSAEPSEAVLNRDPDALCSSPSQLLEVEKHGYPHAPPTAQSLEGRGNKTPCLGKSRGMRGCGPLVKQADF